MDETTDITTKQILCLCLRYVEEDTGHIREEVFMLKPIVDQSGQEQTVPKSSDTRWSYAYEILQFICEHYVAVVISLSTISQYKSNGSSDGRRFAFDLLKPEIAFQIHIMRDALRPALKFLRQIEKRGSCLDDFSINVDAARNTIMKSVERFDFNHLRTILNDVHKYLPVIQPTSRSTRSQLQSSSTDFDELEFRNIGKEFIDHFQLSFDNRFNGEAKELIENIVMLSSPSKFSAEQLLQNELIIKYSSPITYKHAAVDRQIYQRTDIPLLNYQQLEEEVFAFLTIIGDRTSIAAILERLALHGSEQCSEWYKLYQILGTFALGSNEAERTFSTLRRVKSWLRNCLSDSTLQILVKMSTLNIDLTDDGIKFIIEDFINNPKRANSRNINVFMERNNENEFNDDI
ncbi:unnamed protein product [Rotaria sp. Silwood1]|nr:unnamed protein product [Rotaria sp. Silwood1]CAF1606452.1 unnamed protein product [Rotaria sp. Silwood1]CAF3687780.1 unnamed protein product [Rotaria sp. Silwood1]CAF3720907.1 unnamed protein product [Rotaria sp. Silwood1]CAF4886468.1 unnamed protein product [Rotaria sp. Silwood1]